MRNVNIMNTWTMFVFNLYPVLILASAEKQNRKYMIHVLLYECEQKIKRQTIKLFILFLFNSKYIKYITHKTLTKLCSRRSQSPRVCTTWFRTDRGIVQTIHRYPIERNKRMV